MKTISLSHDSFRTPKYLFGLGLLLLGILAIQNEIIVGLILLSLSLLLFAFTSGLEINTENKSYRHYKSTFGLKRGEWKPLSKYTAQIILKKTGKRKVLGPSLARELSFSSSEYELYLTDSTHRLRFFIKSFEYPDSARIYARKLFQELNIPLEKYSPKISDKTRARIERRKRKN